MMHLALGKTRVAHGTFQALSVSWKQRTAHHYHMKIKTSLLILALLLPAVSQATVIIPLPAPGPGVIQQIISMIGECKFNVPCYFSHKAGSTLTTINGSDQISASRSVINTNFSNLNTDKLQSGDTAASLTITTGNITTGTIGTLTLTNKLTVPNGGTSSTTLSSNQVLLGAGTSQVGVVSGWGNSGQLLTSSGGVLAPTWQSASFDTTQNYTLTGNWLFTKAASSTLLGALDTLYVGRTASSTIQGDTAGTSQLQGFLNVLGTGVSTSTISANLNVMTNASTSVQTISKKCTGCISGYELITASSGMNAGSPSTVVLTPTCSTGKVVLSGGYDASVTPSPTSCVIYSKPSGSTAWTVSFSCGSGSTVSPSAYAICVNP